MAKWVWQPHWKHERVDFGRCRAAVYSDRGCSSQCARKGVVEEEDYLWCKQHAPSAQKKRDDDRKAEDRRLVVESDRRYKRSAAFTALGRTAIDLTKGKASMAQLDAAVAAYEKL